MAQPILEDQALDYTKPFTVEFTYRDADGKKRSVVKETFPLKQSVKNMATLGLQAPWDSGVLKLLVFTVVLICGSFATTGCNADHSERDAHIKRYCEEHLIDEHDALEKSAKEWIAGDDRASLGQWAKTPEQKRAAYMDIYRDRLDSCINDTLAKAGQ
jgi:hypothetical protein